MTMAWARVCTCRSLRWPKGAAGAVRLRAIFMLAKPLTHDLHLSNISAPSTGWPLGIFCAGRMGTSRQRMEAHNNQKRREKRMRKNRTWALFLLATSGLGSGAALAQTADARGASEQ